MKITILRNALLEKNAGLYRIITALIDENEISVISRNREKTSKAKIEKRTIENKIFNHIEIIYESKMGSGIKNLSNLINYQFKLFKLLKRNKRNVDVIHSFDLDTGLPTLIFSKIFQKKYVYHIADFYIDSRRGIPTFFKLILKKLEFLVINNAENVIICTEQRMDQIKGSNPKKLDVVHNTPVIPNINNIEIDIDDKKLKITYIGTLTENRFIKELITTVQKNKEIYLTIGGMGPLEEWVNQNSKSFENINFIGKVDYEKSFEIYSKTDLIVALYDPNTPNHKFSAPNKIYESMALKKPIIVAENSGVDIMVKEYSLGYVCKYNSSSFENLISHLANQKEDLLEKSSNASKTYSLFSWEIMKGRIQDIYKVI